nr:hypothetical protein [Tanacetum cinerariifolium]
RAAGLRADLLSAPPHRADQPARCAVCRYFQAVRCRPGGRGPPGQAGRTAARLGRPAALRGTGAPAPEGLPRPEFVWAGSQPGGAAHRRYRVAAGAAIGEG